MRLWKGVPKRRDTLYFLQKKRKKHKKKPNHLVVSGKSSTFALAFSKMEIR